MILMIALVQHKKISINFSKAKTIFDLSFHFNSFMPRVQYIGHYLNEKLFYISL